MEPVEDMIQQRMERERVEYRQDGEDISIGVRQMKTCGNCGWWHKRSFRCGVKTPMWVLARVDHVWENTDATNCPCWRKR